MQNIARHNQGFTLIEMLLALAGIMVITTMLPMIIKLSNDKEQKFSEMEWYIFIQQAEQELRETKQVTITPSAIYLSKWTGEYVQYEKYGTIIRRRVFGTGNETILQSIKKVVFTKAMNGVEVEVITSGDKVYKTRFISFAPLEIVI